MNDFYCIFFFFHLMEKAFPAIKVGVCEGRIGAYLSASYNTGVTRVLSARKGITVHKGKVHLENVNFELTKASVGDYKHILHYLLFFVSRSQRNRGKGCQDVICSLNFFSHHPGKITPTWQAKLISRMFGVWVVL